MKWSKNLRNSKDNRSVAARLPARLSCDIEGKVTILRIGSRRTGWNIG